MRRRHRIKRIALSILSFDHVEDINESTGSNANECFELHCVGISVPILVNLDRTLIKPLGPALGIRFNINYAMYARRYDVSSTHVTGKRSAVEGSSPYWNTSHSSVANCCHFSMHYSTKFQQICNRCSG